MARNNQRGRQNNNPTGRNQYSSDWMDTVRDRPMTSAAAAAAAVGAGVFLWSKRNQISDQITSLSDQITDWTEQRGWTGSSHELAMTEGPNESSAIESSRKTAARTGQGSGPTAKARRSAGRATPQATTM